MKKMIIFIVFVVFLNGCNSSDEIIYDNGNNLILKTNRIVEFDGSLKLDIEKMKTAIKKHDLTSLAAPQVGIKKQIIIVNGTVYLNPLIIKSEGQQRKIVKNISVPGIAAIVNRSKKITVSYQDMNGGKKEKIFTNETAADIQLNIDYLNGVLFYQLADEVWSDSK